MRSIEAIEGKARPFSTWERKLAEKPAGVLQASKKLLKRSSRERAASAAKAEFQEYSARVISADFKEAMTAFFEKRRPDFTKTKN